MQQLLETLIKEKGLWNSGKEYLPPDVGLSFGLLNNGEIELDYHSKAGIHTIKKNIWHIDTLREIVRCKYQDQSNVYSDYQGELWERNFYKLCQIESPQERENYLLNTN